MQDSLKILETVNNFYTQSFGQLMNLTVAIIAFAGVFLPILLTWYQKRLFGFEQQAIEKAMQSKLEEEVKKAVIQIKAEYEKKEKIYEDKISEIKKELQEQVDNAQGGIFHVQGNNDLKQELYLSALNSFLNASQLFIDSEDNMNLRRVLNLITDDCLPHINSDEINNSEETNKEMAVLIELLKDYNTNGNFNDLIQSLVKSYAEAKKRKQLKVEEE